MCLGDIVIRICLVSFSSFKMLSVIEKHVWCLIREGHWIHKDWNFAADAANYPVWWVSNESGKPWILNGIRVIPVPGCTCFECGWNSHCTCTMTACQPSCQFNIRPTCLVSGKGFLFFCPELKIVGVLVHKNILHLKCVFWGAPKHCQFQRRTVFLRSCHFFIGGSDWRMFKPFIWNRSILSFAPEIDSHTSLRQHVLSVWSIGFDKRDRPLHLTVELFL